MHENPKKLVINAIHDLGRRVTAADVATKTGLPVLVVQQKLNEVASDTSGHMQVGTAGDVVYAFGPGFSNAYIAKGIKAAFLNAASKTFSFLFYLVRISFGIALILSLVTIVVIIIGLTLVMQMRGSDDERRGGDDLFSGGLFPGGAGFHLNFWDWMLLRDLFFWNTYNRYQPVTYNYNAPTVRRRQRSSFLLNCFSFLFGDGDPNEGLQEKRWQLIAQVIKHNNNVVTAEQLAPYTGADPKNEDAVLPVLARFNGKPEVTEKGNIVYVFESLQSVAADQKINPPPYLQEFEWKFSNVDQGELLPVYIVAGLNFAGAWWLWRFITHLQLVQAPPTIGPSIHGFVVLVACLVIYGTAFVAIPIIRTLINKIRNAGIEKRNIKLFKYSQLVANPTPELKDKLRESYAYKIRDRRLTQQDVVYTTEKDSLDQADELSDKFKEIEEKQTKTGSSGGSAATRKTNAANKDSILNFSPEHDDSAETDESQSTGSAEGDGNVIDLSTRAQKMKLPRKGGDFDATP